MGETC